PEVVLGDFIFPATTPVGGIAIEYDLPVSRREASQTLGLFLTEKLNRRPAIGDSYRIGESELVVCDIVQDHIAQVALRLEAVQPPLLPAWAMQALERTVEQSRYL